MLTDYSFVGILIVAIYALLVVGAIVLAVILGRLMLVATRTLGVIAEERRLRLDLLIARGDGELGI